MSGAPMGDGSASPTGRGRVVVVGSLNLDHTVRVAHLPAPGATVAGYGYATAAGGKGLNQAVAAARQGAEVVMIGAVGDDAAGGLLAGVLTHERIGTDGLRRVAGPSGTALITVTEDGQNTIVVAPGANGELTEADVRPELLAGAAVVLCQLEVPQAVVHAALRGGRAVGALTVLNPAPASGPLDAGLLALVDMLVPNETEAVALRGDPACDPVEAASSLLAAGTGTAVVTLGRRGAVIVRDGTTTEISPFAVEAVDPTAAGDAFLGAMVAAVAAGETIEWAAVRGAAAGALAATRDGAVPSLPQRDEVDRLVARVAPVGAGRATPSGSRPRSRSAGAPPGGPRRPRRHGGPGAGRGGPPRPGGSRS